MSAPEPLPITDYLPFYDLERYLFETLSPRFTQSGTLSSFDFFCIVIWKSNRSKSKVARRLQARIPDLEEAIRVLIQEVVLAKTPQARLSVLLEGWGFRLAIASALLTVLYPETFTVYDYRAVEALGDFAGLSDLSFTRLWARYEAYIQAVRESGPAERSLRDKDRALWTQSFHVQLERDLERGFGSTELTFLEE